MTVRGLCREWGPASSKQQPCPHACGHWDLWYAHTHVLRFWLVRQKRDGHVLYSVAAHHEENYAVGDGPGGWRYPVVQAHDLSAQAHSTGLLRSLHQQDVMLFMTSYTSVLSFRGEECAPGCDAKHLQAGRPCSNCPDTETAYCRQPKAMACASSLSITELLTRQDVFKTGVWGVRGAQRLAHARLLLLHHAAHQAGHRVHQRQAQQQPQHPGPHHIL